MKVDFSIKHVAIYICAFFVVQVSTTFAVASLAQPLHPTASEKTIHLVVNECDMGNTENVSQQNLGINRNQDTYTHELPRIRF